MRVEAGNIFVKATSSRTIAARSSSMFKTMLLALMLMFGAQAHADPGAAARELQSAKYSQSWVRAYFNYGQSVAYAGDAATARWAFQNADLRAAYLNLYAANLYFQNLDTLDRGLYRNRDAQLHANYYCAVLRTQVQSLRLSLNSLLQYPLWFYYLSDAAIRIYQIDSTLAQIEDAMTRAQQ